MEAVKVKSGITNAHEQHHLDAITLDKTKYTKGFLRFLFFTALAIIAFFIPVTIDGETVILFGFIYNFLIDLFGIVGIWAITLVTVGNAFACLYGKFIARPGTKLYSYYQGENIIQLLIYLLGAVYSVLYTLHISFEWFIAPEMIVGDGTGGLIMSIAQAIFWVIPLGAIFIPMLVNYGAIDLVGTLFEPIMRPVFKVPGKSAVDAVSSFMTSSSVAVLITNKLYRSNVYTQKEAATIATSFSSVSVGFAAVVFDTAGLMEHFVSVFFSSLLIAFLISFVMVRIPPLSRKPNVYFNGEVLTKEMEKSEIKYERGIVKKAVSRAIKQGYLADKFFKETRAGILEGLAVMPKVLCMVSAVGVTCLILAEYTQIFNWIGQFFIPILHLFAIPNAAEIAPAILLGIAEMFLPVLMIADSVETLDIGARYFITALSMVQIIFFAETGAVMLSLKLPIKFWELVVLFLLRTLVAIPFIALFMHILF